MLMTKHFFVFSFLLSFFSIVEASVIERQSRLNASLSEILIQPKILKSIEGGESVVTLFTIHGSNTIGGSLAPKIAMSYLKAKGVDNVRIQPLLTENESVIKGDLISQGKTVQIKVAAHGSSTGFNSLMNSDADIWASSRPVKDKEVEQVKDRMDLRAPSSEHILGIDGLAIVVNPSNLLSSLSKSQLGQIFSGEINNWSQIGGEDQAVYTQEMRTRVLGTVLKIWFWVKFIR